MKKRMSVPFKVTKGYDGNVMRCRPNNTDYQWVTSKFVFDAARDVLESALIRDASKELASSRPYGHFGPFNATYEGTPKQPLPTKYIPLSKVKVNNGDAWRKAKRTGEIVMSNYKDGMIELNYKYGSIVTNPGRALYLDLNASNEGLFETLNGYPLIGGWVYFSVPFFLHFYLGREEVEGPSPYDEGWSDAAYAGSMDSTIKGLTVDGGLVTSCLAEANSGTLDALTAMAEAPETLKSMMEATKVSLNLYKDARKGALRLYNQAKGKSNRETLKKNSQEVADAIANVWMNFRYNIMPNIYLIRDLQETLLLNNVLFVRYRDTLRNSFHVASGSSFKSGGEFTSTERVLIKRRLALNGATPKFDYFVLKNIFVTGYELLPLSFVADWFVNVGDVIAATTINPGVTQEGSTYSWKVDGTCNYVSNTAFKSAVSVTLKGYRRDLISPSAHTCLTWKPELNLFRYLDSIALGWGAFKRTIHAKN